MHLNVPIKVQEQLQHRANMILREHTEKKIGEAKIKLDGKLVDAINKDLDAMFREVEAKFHTKIPFNFRVRITGPAEMAILPVVLN